LRIAKIDLYNARIRAPYSGVVSLRHTVAGAFLDVGAPVVTLINDRDLEIEADVPASRLGALSPGTPVTVQLRDGVNAWVAVRAIVPDENPMNQTVVLDLPIAEARQVTSVHKDAVIVRQGQHRVFVVEGDHVQDRTVRLGAAVGNRFAVVDGLKPGDLVVVRGNERLQSGQKVRFDGSS
jgi:multidrug efflux pump subunit AcrA (membrane-fusion protein)